MLLNITDNQQLNYKITANAITPRPIAWISTISENNITNLAPFSFFAPLCTAPLIFSICISLRSDGTQKDTLLNVKATKKLTINTAQESMLESMKLSSEELAHDISEFQSYNIEPLIIDSAYPPIVANSMAAFLCDLRDIMHFSANSATLIVEAKKFYINDTIYNEDLKFQLENIGRVGRKFINNRYI